MKEQELKKIYFDFYDQLEEPIRSKAKENWDYKIAKINTIPSGLKPAIRRGFLWDDTPQKHEYWESLSESIDDYIKKNMVNSQDSYEEKDSYFKEITQGICELLTEKDKRYGSFIDSPLEIFEGKCISGRDIDKKLSRIKNADHLRLNDVADIIGYLILAMREKKWTKEDILKLID